MSHGCFDYTNLKLYPNGKVIGHLECGVIPDVVFLGKSSLIWASSIKKSNAPPQLVKFSEIMHRIATRFRLVFTVAVLAAAKVAAQEAPSAAGQNVQPNAGSEEASVKRVVDGIMQPYLAQGQRMAGGHPWKRSPFLGTIVAVSLHGHRYFFPYGKSFRRGRSVHARNPGGNRLLHQDVHHHVVCASHQPQPNRA